LTSAPTAEQVLERSDGLNQSLPSPMSRGSSSILDAAFSMYFDRPWTGFSKVYDVNLIFFSGQVDRHSGIVKFTIHGFLMDIFFFE
jgi:hypothetical protein